MRMSRKRGRSLRKLREAEEQREPSFPYSMRMTRKRRRRLEKFRLTQGPLIPAFPHFTRMSRQRKRQKREREEFSRDVTQMAAASLSTIYVMQTWPFHTHTHASSSINTFTDVSSYFDYMRNARDRIRGHKMAEENVLAAKENRLQAQQDLLSAEEGLHQAEEDLRAAEEQLTAVERQQSRIKVALLRARDASEQRTQIALASQRAVADFLPQVYAQQGEVDRLAALASARESEYLAYQESVADQFSSPVADGGETGDRAAKRAEVIEQTWQSVDYAQNRLNDVQVMVEEQLAGQPVERVAREAAISDEIESNLRYYEDRMEGSSRAADDARALLDDMEAQLDALKDQQREAEDNEANARQEVRDLEQDQQQAELDHRQAQVDLEETRKLLAEARVWLEDAEKNEEQAAQEQIKAEYELEHFGEGHSYGLGMEYYAWEGNRGGHQFYLPLSVSGEEEGWDWALETGFVNSSSGKEHGTVSGWANTALSASLHNDHPVSDVRYRLTVNVPTGKSGVNEKANLPDELARMTSFNEGWSVTPEIDMTRHITERDSLTARVSWTWRGDYDVRQDREPGGEEMLLTASPGNLWKQEGEYLHAGEHHQFLGLITHLSSDSARVGDYRYRDGDEFSMKAFYSQDVSPKDSWQTYAVIGYSAGTKGGDEPGTSIWRQYYGLGWTHEIRKNESWWAMVNYMKGTGAGYNYTSGQPIGDRNRWSLQVGYDRRLSSDSLLRLKLERYSMRDAAAGNYHGWNTAVMFYRTF